MAVSVLTACRPDASETPPPETRSVALAVEAGTPGWLARRAADGLARAAEELGLTPVDLGEVPPSRLREVVRSLGESDAVLAFLVGEGWAPVVYTEAVAYPGTRFAVIGEGAVGEGVIAISFLRAEAVFLGGVLAGLASPSRTAAMVPGDGDGSGERLTDAFAAGFERVRGRVEMLRAETAESFAALAQSGVRTAFVAAQRLEAELLEAAAAAGVGLVVLDPSLVEGGAPAVLAAVSVDLAEAMARVASDDPEIGRRSYVFDLSSGIVDLAIAGPVREAIGAEGAETLAAARAEITAGIAEVERLGF